MFLSVRQLLRFLGQSAIIAFQMTHQRLSKGNLFKPSNVQAAIRYSKQRDNLLLTLFQSYAIIGV